MNHQKQLKFGTMEIRFSPSHSITSTNQERRDVGMMVAVSERRRRRQDGCPWLQRRLVTNRERGAEAGEGSSNPMAAFMYFEREGQENRVVVRRWHQTVEAVVAGSRRRGKKKRRTERGKEGRKIEQRGMGWGLFVCGRRDSRRCPPGICGGRRRCLPICGVAVQRW